jgi:hypothetical protein
MESDSQSMATTEVEGPKKHYYSDADDAVLRQFVSSHPGLKSGRRSEGTLVGCLHHHDYALTL